MEKLPITILGANGGLNTDDSLISPPGPNNPWESGDYRYARNVRIGSSYEDNTGAIENLPSTLEVSNYYQWDGSAFIALTPPSGTFTALNKVEDKKTQSIYWFVHSTNGTDGYILKFSKTEQKIYEILFWSGMNFSKQYLPQGALISNYLFWADGLNPNRMIDVTDIYKLKQTLGSNFSEFHISFHKWSPLAPPLIKRNTVGTSEFVRKGIFQFRYRYIYKGGFKSTFSPESWFVTNEITGNAYTFNVDIPGFFFNTEDPANPFFHSSIKFYSVVQYIEIIYRQSTKDAWKLFRRYPVATSGNEYFDFENNGPIAIIPEIDTDQPFDSVPLKSSACEAIDNRPMFGDNLDEYQVSTFRVENVSVYAVRSIDNNWNGPSTAFTSLTTPQQNELNRIINSRQFSFLENGVYKLGIKFQGAPGRTGLVQSTDDWSYIIPSDPAYGMGGYVFALGFKIPNDIIPPDWAVSYTIVRSNCLNIDFALFGTVNDFVLLGLSTQPGGEKSQTPQAVVDIMNAYGDASNPSPDFTLSERLANYYRKETVVSTMAAASRIGINITNWTHVNKANSGGTTMNPSNSIFYNWRKGDRVRFVGSSTESIQVGDLRIFDCEIVDYNGNYIFINKPSGLDLLPQRSTTPNNDLFFEIEIYRPKQYSKDESITYYEMGEWYPVLNPTTNSRDFSKRDFTWGGASAVTISSVGNHVIYNRMPIINGDIWVVNKYMYYDWASAAFPGVSVRSKYMQMTQDKTNAYGFWEHNTGQPSIAYKYIPQDFQKETQIRFGLKFLEDSVFNGINTFRAQNQFIYPSEYGRIRALVNTSNAVVESVGNILLAIGEDESWSIYINRTTLEDLSGRSQVSVSDKVLGSFNTLLGSQGTLNPESISKERGRVIWWNNKKGCWVRYSRDGMTDISDFNMRNWFQDLADLLSDTYSTSEKPKVISTYDEYHNEWIIRIDHSLLPSNFRGYSSYKCVSFAERNADKRWKSFYDFAPDLFAKMNNTVYSIIGRKIHIHEAGADFGKIYGSSVPAQIEFVVSKPQVTDFRSIKLIATDRWSFEQIRGDWKSNNATIQQSRILLNKLELKEGAYWSEFMKDMNSPNAASTADGVVNGNAIKSRSLRLLLQIDPDVDYYSILNSLSVLVQESPKN